MKELTFNQSRVLKCLAARGGEWVSPTEIGLKVGGRTSGGWPRHSGWSSPICKALVKKGLAERNERGHYRAKDEVVKLFYEFCRAAIK